MSPCFSWVRIPLFLSIQCSIFLTLFKLEDNYFTILWWFLSYTDMNQPQMYMCPAIPLGCSRALALIALRHVSNLHWSSILHMIIYMFKWYFLKPSHSSLLPQNPKVCYLQLCLFWCLAYRVIAKLHIYICLYAILVFLFLIYFTLYLTSLSFIHLIRTDLNALLL